MALFNAHMTRFYSLREAMSQRVTNTHHLEYYQFLERLDLLLRQNNRSLLP